MLGLVPSPPLTSGRAATIRTRLLSAAAVLLAAGAVVALSTVGSGPGRPAATATDPAAVDTVAVSALLHAHAAALLHRDRDAYAAGLDDAAPATQFRAAQLAVFDHTDGVPFASFDLGLNRSVVDNTSVAAARTRLGDASAQIVRADLTYAYTGVDARPARHAVYLTLVRRDGGWKLAGDTDLAAVGGASWRGPWDFGPLVVVRGSTTLVLGHPASDEPVGVVRAQTLLRGIASDVDAGVTAVNGVWGTQWPRRVAVEVAATQPEMDELAGPGYDLGSVAAVAVAEPTTSVTEGADVTAGQRIVLSGPAVPGLSAVGRAVLLRHELTHVATRSVTVAGMPTWVVEGFADYVGNLGSVQPPRTAAAELAAQLAATGPPATLPVDAAFVPADGSTGGDAGTTGTGTGTTRTGTAGSAAAAAYEQAWFGFRTLASLAGPTAPAAFYRAVAAAVAAGTDPAAAVDTALRDLTEQTTAAFTASWRTLVEQDLAP